MSVPVVRVSGIRKTYGKTVAVDDVSFEVQPGEIFGLIGPNGAGKTTTMECAEGLRQPDRGRIEIFGLDPTRDVSALQDRIGVQLQEAQLQKRIKVWEAVDLWASLYPRTVDGDRLLDQLGLTEKRDAWFMTLSGGQKQRLFIALALINDPELIFLDELTTGLDPQARRAIWDLVRDIRERGKTVFLTTHLMEEAERLWRSLKYECVYLSEFATGSQARTGIGRWMDFYDRRRPHSSLNDRTPDEAYTDDGADRSPGLRPVSCQPTVA